MNLDQYFLALGFGYLKATPEKAKSLSALLKGLPYDFEKPRMVGKYSIGGEGSDQQVVGFLEWANRLRLEGILSMSVESLNRTSLADPIAAGFLNGTSELLTIQTKKRSYVYALIAINSSSTEATARELLIICNAQKNAEQVKAYLYEELTGFFLLNKISYEKSATLDELLVAHESRYWESISSRLIQEMQIEVAVEGHSLVIPPEVSELLHRFERDPAMEDSSENDNTVYFYSVGEVTAEQIAKLVEFQPNADLILHQTQIQMSMYGMDLNIDFTAKDWKSQLKMLSNESLKTAESLLSRAIADDCRKNGTRPLIPEDQIDLWGPSHEELRRIRLRGKTQMNGYYFTANKNPWSLYCFREVTAFALEPIERSAGEALDRDSVAMASENFRNSLERIFRFSDKVKSSFTEAFHAGLFLLKTDLPTISFHTSEGIAVLKKFLKTNGFNEKVQDIIAAKAELFEDFRKFQEDPLEYRCWCSFEVTGVFGGMGSWNDMGFQNEEVNEEYSLVTHDFFEARKKLYFSLFNY